MDQPSKVMREVHKVIYLIDQPLDERNYKRFGIEHWLNRGWQVEVWDITPFVHPKIWSSFLEHGDAIYEFSGYKSCFSLKEIKEMLRLSPVTASFFVDAIGTEWKALLVRHALIAAKVIGVKIIGGSIPGGESSQSSFYLRAIKAIFENPKRFISRLFNLVYQKWLYRKHDRGLIVVPGQIAFDLARVNYSDKSIIKAHNFDYDTFLRLSAVNTPFTEALIVFLDEDAPYHRDYEYLNIKPFVTAENYYPTIVNGLKKVSKELNAPVVVALHPTSFYVQRKQSDYKEFEISIGKSAELIQNASLIIGHASTAIQMGVLFNKPILIMTTDELERSKQKHSITAMAQALGKKVINFDQITGPIDWQKESAVDMEKYEQYKNNFIKMAGSENIPLWDIVINKVKKRTLQALVS